MLRLLPMDMSEGGSGSGPETADIVETVDPLLVESAVVQAHACQTRKSRLHMGAVLNDRDHISKIVEQVREITPKITTVDGRSVTVESLVHSVPRDDEGALGDAIHEGPHIVVVKNAGHLSERAKTSLIDLISGPGYQGPPESPDPVGTDAVFQFLFTPPHPIRPSDTSEFTENMLRPGMLYPRLVEALDLMVPVPRDVRPPGGTGHYLDSSAVELGEDPVPDQFDEYTGFDEYAEVELDWVTMQWVRARPATTPDHMESISTKAEARETAEKLATGVASTYGDDWVTDDHVAIAGEILRDATQRACLIDDVADQSWVSDSGSSE